MERSGIHEEEGAGEPSLPHSCLQPQPYMHGTLHNVTCLSKVENHCRETKQGPPSLKYYLQCLTFHYASESPSWMHSVLPRCPRSLSLSFPLLLGQLPADDSELTPSPGIALSQRSCLAVLQQPASGDYFGGGIKALHSSLNSGRAITALEFCRGSAEASVANAPQFKSSFISSEWMLTPLFPLSLIGIP